MLLPGDKGKTIAHFQQITGNVLYQLLFYVPFVCFSFAPAKSKMYGSFNR